MSQHDTCVGLDFVHRPGTQLAAAPGRTQQPVSPASLLADERVSCDGQPAASNNGLCQRSLIPDPLDCLARPAVVLHHTFLEPGLTCRDSGRQRASGHGMLRQGGSINEHMPVEHHQDPRTAALRGSHEDGAHNSPKCGLWGLLGVLHGRPGPAAGALYLCCPGEDCGVPACSLLEVQAFWCQGMLSVSPVPAAVLAP